MRKIDCLFQRQHFDMSTGEWVEQRNKNTKYLAVPGVTPGCEWVLKGEGVATVKWDGTAVLITKVYSREGNETFLYQRYTHKRYGGGQGQMADDAEYTKGWIKADDRLELGREIFWIPATDKWIDDAFKNSGGLSLVPGTYEAIGPKINGNRQKLNEHILRKHGDSVIAEEFAGGILMERCFAGISEYLKDFHCFNGYHYEGLVFHHPDGRMAKITRKDFGFEG